MIDTDETGNKKLSELKRRAGELDEDSWAYGFITSITKDYADLSSRQQSKIGELYENIFGRVK